MEKAFLGATKRKHPNTCWTAYAGMGEGLIKKLQLAN